MEYRKYTVYEFECFVCSCLEDVEANDLPSAAYQMRHDKGWAIGEVKNLAFRQIV